MITGNLAAMLFTVYALLAVVCSVAAVWARRAARDAAHSEQRLMQSRGRLIALEGALEALDAKHRKLAGRVYRTEQREPEPDPTEGLPLEEKNRLIRERLRSEHGLPKISRSNGAQE